MLLKASKGESKSLTKATKTVSSYGIPINDAENILKKFEIINVNEDDLIAQIMLCLGKTITGCDPQQAFKSLMWWVLESAEQKRVICGKDAIEYINLIGTFLAGRSAFQSEWNTTIIPIAQSEQRIKDNNSLLCEFYQGVGARYEHIVLNLDIPRYNILYEIDHLFQSHNIVILKGASGQGKSTTAYRYCRDFVPSEFCYRIKHTKGIRHARKVALAISQHSNAIITPTFIFIDVLPGDANWYEIVSELSALSNIRILVCIRTEDWIKNPLNSYASPYADIDIVFTKEEAEIIYERLSERQVCHLHLNFDDAWITFGSNGPLLEFVYYITNTKLLKERLKEQVRILRDEIIAGRRERSELEFLKIVSFATSYEANINMRSGIFSKIGLSCPERTLELFENEYFLRANFDDNSISSLHHIRSQILSEILVHESIGSSDEIAIKCLQFIAEADIENFLLHFFSRISLPVCQVFKQICSFLPSTWSGRLCVVRSLIWLGIKQYIQDNIGVIDEAWTKVFNGWYLLLNWDIVQASDNQDGILGIFKNTCPDAMKMSLLLRKKQSPIEDVFKYLDLWLKQIDIEFHEADNAEEHLSKSEFIYWTSYVNALATNIIAINDGEFDKAFKQVDIEQLGDYVDGVYKACPAWYNNYLSKNRDKIFNHIGASGHFVKYDEDEHVLCGHYLIPFDYNEIFSRQNLDNIDDDKNILHSITRSKMTLLGKVFPGKNKYGAIGYGHRNAILPMLYDDAEMAGVNSKYVIPKWIPKTNSIFRCLVEYRYRLDEWDSYFNEILAVRRLVISSLDDLLNSFRVHGNKKKGRYVHKFMNKKLWDFCREKLNKGVMLPKCAVDEWGLMAEGLSDYSSASKIVKKYSAPIKLKKLLTAKNEFFRSTLNFFNQSLHALILLPLLRLSDNKLKDDIIKVANSQGIMIDSSRLSVLNFTDSYISIKDLQDEFNKYLPKELTKDHLDLVNAEKRVYKSFCNEWYSFVGYTPEAKSHSLKKISTDRAIDKIKKQINDKFRRNNIKANTIDSDARWNNQSALWIKVDTDHPCDQLVAIGLVWNILREVYQELPGNIIYQSIIRLYWKNIVVIPLVKSKSLTRLCNLYCKSAFWENSAVFEESGAAVLSEYIPKEVWDEFLLQEWPRDPRLEKFWSFVESLTELSMHVSHIADLNRIPEKLDPRGFNILQNYLQIETERINSVYQRAIDNCVELIDFINSIPRSELEKNGQIRECLLNFVELKNEILIDSSDLLTTEHSVSDFSDWSIRLNNGLKRSGLIYTLMAAYIFGFNESQYSDH